MVIIPPIPFEPYLVFSIISFNVTFIPTIGFPLFLIVIDLRCSSSTLRILVRLRDSYTPQIPEIESPTEILLKSFSAKQRTMAAVLS